MRKTLLSLALGFTTGLFFSFAVVGFSFTALLSLGFFIPMSIILGCSLTAVFLGNFVPWLIQSGLQKYIEYQVKSSLTEDDIHCSKLKYWLSFANDGFFEPANIWKYTFDDGQSLAEYLVTRSNQQMQKYIKSGRIDRNLLLSAQSNFKAYHYLSYAQKHPREEVISYSLGHRILLWLKKSIDLTSNFNSAPLTDAQEAMRIAQLLQEGIQGDGENTKPHPDSLREKFTPNQLLKRGISIQEPLPLPKESKTAKHTFPKHLNIWKTHLSLHQQIDQFQIKQQTLGVQQNKTIDKKTRLAHQTDSTQWTDSSMVHDRYKLWNILREKHINTALWLSALEDAIKDFNNHQGEQQFLSEAGSRESKYNPKFKMYVTEEAKKILLLGENSIRGHATTHDLDILPLGFFLDRNNETWTLKYSPDYRLWQLENLPDAHLMIDPASSLFNAPRTNFAVDGVYETKGRATKEEFLQALEKLKITPSQAQLELLGRLDNDIFPAFETHKKEQVFKALILIASESAHSGQILKILDTLLIFEPITFRYSKTTTYSNWFSEDDNSLLYFFLYHHLTRINSGKAFDHPLYMEYFSRLTKLTSEELKWFGHLTAQKAHELSYYDFEELCKGLFCFVDFFKAQGIPLPKEKPEGNYIADYQEPIAQLKGYLDCISLTQKNKSMQRLQAQFFDSMPLDIAISKAQLRAGYSFVHRSMCFDSSYVANASLRKKFNAKFPQLVNPFIIGAEEFKNTVYSSTLPGKDDVLYYRALYLRFVALNVDPSAVETALNEWEKITQSSINSCESLWQDTTHQTEFHHLKQSVSAHWETLKNFALSLPRKNKSQSSAYIPDGLANEAYPIRAKEKYIASKQHTDSDVRELLEKLSLSESMKIELSKQISELNNLIGKYHSMNSDELDSALKNARDLPLEERLALLRETHYRLSRSEKNAAGEWLRLEQLVSVLISLKKDTLFQVDTSEGKTLIIQLITLLKALDGNPVYVLTHNEVLAEKASDKLQTLASLLQLKVTNKNNSNDDIATSNIHYIDIASAVLEERLAKLRNNNKNDNPVNKVAIIDEVDNVVIDIHANSTMQISQNSQEASKECIQFLILLNKAVRTQLVNAQTPDPTKHRQIVRDAVKDSTYYQQENLATDENLDFWIKAAVTAMQYQEKQDYVVEKEGLEEIVYLVHKDTTGRVDKISQWSDGVHQCVAAWEKENGHTAIKVPGIAQVLAEGDIATYLEENFISRCAFTATLGEPHVQQQIEALAHSELVVKMPRAQRELAEGASWPKIIDKTDPAGTPTDCFNRSYRFPPIYVEGEEEHFAKIVEALRNAHDNQQSTIVFFNTITECEYFYNYLLEHNFSGDSLSSHLQILDDTHAPEAAAIRPDEETIIARAGEKQMITLTTAAGSRGTDFEDIDVGIIAKPGLGRVVIQKSGRIGRNGALGVVYEIYNNEDLILSDELESPANEAPIQNPFRERVEKFEQRKQAADLEAILSRAKLRKENQQLQEHFFNARSKITSEKQELLENAWCQFFSKYGRKESSLTLSEKLEHFNIEVGSLVS
ncbi:helicase-related protein [Legionella brunensis]|uniref:Preprotein translocase, secretion protein SecA subunit n=1 Tax=Legionella brunensis TaxID=29422 RepID=A0A0W0SL80_9GAMM|nr:helicase-related protein [Legionella brunensis]KTC84099.1 preprotein translocase, secretion protein SecA subunit [Legionella brunensis]